MIRKFLVSIICAASTAVVLSSILLVVTNNVIISNISWVILTIFITIILYINLQKGYKK